jgi:hypothetical protein
VINHCDNKLITLLSDNDISFGNLYLRLRKMSHIIYAAIMEKSVTFTGACANEIIPSINHSLVYKAKEGGHVRMVYIYYFEF